MHQEPVMQANHKIAMNPEEVQEYLQFKQDVNKINSSSSKEDEIKEELLFEMVEDIINLDKKI